MGRAKEMKILEFLQKVINNIEKLLDIIIKLCYNLDCNKKQKIHPADKVHPSFLKQGQTFNLYFEP